MDAEPHDAPPPPPPPESSAETPAKEIPAGAPCDPSEVEPRIVEVLKTVFDPEIPINIYELGLIYKVDVAPDTGHTKVTMTLTSPNCPAAATLPAEVETKVGQVEGVSHTLLDLVWEPPWDKDMMSEAAKLALGID